MDAWQLWQEMARESEEAARLAETGACLRPAASRYYAAYQAVTALLLYRGLIPPRDREAWSHEDTPDLLQDQLQALIGSRDRRSDLADRLSGLYRLRLVADYRVVLPMTVVQVTTAGRNARFILRVMDESLPGRQN